MTPGELIARFGIPLLLAIVAVGVVAFLLLRDLGRRDTDVRAKARTDLILGRPGEHRSRFGLRGTRPPADDADSTRSEGDDR